jgi:hypothetical protein
MVLARDGPRMKQAPAMRHEYRGKEKEKEKEVTSLQS